MRKIIFLLAVLLLVGAVSAVPQTFNVNERFEQ